MGNLNKNKNEKRIIPLRSPGETVQKHDNRPSKLLFDEVSRQLELENNPDQTQTDQTQAEPIPDPDHLSTYKNQKLELTLPLAPVRDYNKRANSIDRDALPLGVFPGASKKIYDAVYLRTRGAIVPSRTIQATRRELMLWSGIQNIKTINAHLKRLKDCGLFKVVNFVGEQSGSIYEVFLPEEIGLDLNPDQTQTSHTSTIPSPVPDQIQKMDSDQTQKTVWVGSGKPIENKGASGEAKTLLKTLKLSDDEAPLISAFEKLNEAARAATGKELTKKDLEAFEEIVELIINETSIARTRTNSISVYLKFAAENLRRRLYSKSPVKKLAEKAKANSIQVGKNEFAPEPLGEFKAEALESLQNMVDKNGFEVLEIFRTGYIEEDWQWLVENLKAKN